MQAHLRKVIVSSFKLGYFYSLFESEIESLFGSDAQNPNMSNCTQNYKSLFLFEDDYKNVFGESLITFPQFRNKQDVSEYLTAFFNLIKEKISLHGNVKIELAYFAGAALAVAYNNQSANFDKQKLYEIFSMLLSFCGKEESMSEVEDYIEVLFSDDIYESMIARYNLIKIIFGEDLNPAQKEVFNHFDKVVVDRY
ncbi:MAG TPA: hypothetical protein ENN33_02365 [Ignavibacteria bacterium]|nr:hypothetical protein [Ignavibacteria bacterium]